MNRRRLLKLLAAAPASVPPLLADASAQSSDWPRRNINIIVPFPPGGQGDLAARPVADALSRTLGRAVFVENRGGAGGKIGNAFVARAEPDGYTLLCTLSSLAVLPEADRLFNRPVAYEVTDLAPIARLLADPTVLAVSTSSPWRTLEDFVADAKRAPGTIPYGSSGSYGTLHVAMEMFATEAGIKLLHVPYSGGGPALNALLGGNVQALASAPGVLKPQVDAGAVRILANWGAERVPSFPEVKTFKELGYPNVEFYIWAGLFAPKATPVDVIDRLRVETKAAMADPAIIKIFDGAGSPPAWLDAPDFADFVATDSARLIKAVEKIGKVD
jgi:tripartite-type tricarboxylate transporter receptor subunit TctC